MSLIIYLPSATICSAYLVKNETVPTDTKEELSLFGV